MNVDDPRHFRSVLGHFPTSVVAITTMDDRQPRGMVVGTFTSVSLAPPLVAFLVDRNSATLPFVKSAGGFCANALASNQEALSRRMSGPAADRFCEVVWQPSTRGNPILDGVVAWVDCAIETIVEMGDHELIAGRVDELSIQSMRTPLLFFRGGYGDYSSITTALVDQLVGW